MTIYTCDICIFSTHRFSDYNRHLKTKKHRLNEVSSMNIPKELMGMNQNEPQMNQNEPAMNHNEPVNIQKDIKKYPCDYCEETFNTLMIRTSKNIHKTSTNIHKTSTNIQIFTLVSIAKKHSLIFPINADMNYTDVKKIQAFRILLL